VDLLSMMVGAYVGQGMRTMIRHEPAMVAAAAPVVPTPMAPALPAAPTPGLGAYGCYCW
jgi:hypothetical protein